MNINYKQPQFELFPANSATLEDVNKPKFLLANLTLSIESLVIFSILGIMVALFSFSLGVERGKHLAAQALDEKVAAAWNVGRVAVPAVAAVPPAVVAMPKPVLEPVVYKRNSLSAKIRAAMSGHAVSPSAAVTGTGRLTLQIATYGNEEYAKQDALALRAKGFQSFLVKSGKYWLVCIGNFNTKDNAAAFAKKMPSQYRSSQIRRF